MAESENSKPVRDTSADFEDGAPRVTTSDALILDLDGFEGPLDALLGLARTQKVDLTKISILQLSEQYLAFIQGAHDLKLEIAADYLVMAAWLAYMKSRLLLPAPEEDDEPSGEEMAEALARRLRRLNAMREAVQKLLQRPRLTHDVFGRGAPEGVNVVRISVFESSLFDLLKAYVTQDARAEAENLVITASEVYSMEDAYRRLADMLGTMPNWESLARFLPQADADPLVNRSAVATTFAASLELAREGRLSIRQHEPFGPIYIRHIEDAT